MGRVNQIQIKQKYIYAKDATQRQIFVFDKAGKFVTKLAKKGNGQGPNEYLVVNNINIDTDRLYSGHITCNGA
jgi:hypothetical protein